MNGLFAAIGGGILSVIDAMGYRGIFFLSLLESAAIPIPSEIVVPFSGFLVSRSSFTMWGVIGAATVGNLAGSLILYAIGRSGARWVLEEYGHWMFVHQRHLDMGDRWFSRHGTSIVFWGRLLPVIRTFISLPAGIARMSLLSFMTWTLLGALPWNAALVYAGFRAGEQWYLIRDSLHWVNYVILACVAAGILYRVWYHKKHA